jgi:hypothetical protein
MNYLIKNKMKRTIIILFAILISGTVFGQKIKIDKKTGKMSIDNVEVSKFSSSSNSEKQEVYSFTDLHSDDYVTLTMVKLSKDGEPFLQVTSSLSDKTSEMDYEIVNFTLNMNSAISTLIVKKYNFFNTSGMNREAIINFLDTENRKYSNIHEVKENQKQAIQDIINSFAPRMKDDYTIINNNTGEVIAEFDDGKPKQHLRDRSLVLDGLLIKDHVGNIVAVIEKDGKDRMSNTYFVNTYNDYKYTISKRMHITDVQKAAVDTLIYYGYFGEGENSLAYKQQLIAEAKTAMIAENKAEAEENKRRMRVNGVLSLENGNVIEGEFDIPFRETKDGKITTRGTIVNLDGKTATHFYLDEKGKNRIKVYKEKQIKSFKVLNAEDPAFDEYYCKIEYIEEPEKFDVVSDASLDVMAIGLNLLSKPKKKTILVCQVAEMNKTTAYIANNHMFIQNKSSREPFIKLTSANFESKLKEVASDCSLTVESISNNKYTYTVKGIYDFMKDYDVCN